MAAYQNSRMGSKPGLDRRLTQNPLKTQLNRDQHSFQSRWRTGVHSESRQLPKSLNLQQRACRHTLGAAPPQWVFYPPNFLIQLQLATCPGSYQAGICIMHTHTHTHYHTHTTPNITFYIPHWHCSISLALSNTRSLEQKSTHL